MKIALTIEVFLIQLTIKNVFYVVFAFFLPGCTVTQHLTSNVLHTFKRKTQSQIMPQSLHNTSISINVGCLPYARKNLVGESGP